MSDLLADIQDCEEQLGTYRPSGCLTPLGLLVLPECPLVALHDYSAVLTEVGGDPLNPVGRSLTDQFPA